MDGYICGHCGEGTIISVTDWREDDGTAQGHFVCDHCEARHGFWMDGGTVDLAAVPQSLGDRNDNDFKVYP